VFFGNEEVAIPVYGRCNFSPPPIAGQPPKVQLLVPCYVYVTTSYGTLCFWCSIPDAVRAHPRADVFINFASMRRCGRAHAS
jgi:hypothetical protein